MSEIASTEAKPEVPQNDDDKNVFTEVERWMELIREISLEQTKSETV